RRLMTRKVTAMKVMTARKISVMTNAMPDAWRRTGAGVQSPKSKVQSLGFEAPAWPCGFEVLWVVVISDALPPERGLPNLGPEMRASLRRLLRWTTLSFIGKRRGRRCGWGCVGGT